MKENMKYLIGLLIAIVVIIFIIIKLLTGGGGGVVQKPAPLSDYADTDTTMRYTVQNPTQATETHREIQITVGQDSSEIVIYKGYNGSVLSRKTYPMTEAAYRDFLRGLMISGDYTNGNPDKALRDESGYCAAGDRFVYEIVDGSGDVKQHFWSTSCGEKTFRGNIPIVQSMFQQQIPDYDTLTENIIL
jgi:hypothetical protein